MSSLVFPSLRSSDGQLSVIASPHDQNKKVTHIVLKTLACLGIGIGGGLAAVGGFGGLYVLGQAYFASALGMKIFTIVSAVLFPVGTGLLYISAALLATTSTALGAAITIPIAGACLILPFAPALPGLLGAIPGAGIGYASYIALKNLEAEEIPTRQSGEPSNTDRSQ